MAQTSLFTTLFACSNISASSMIIILISADIEHIVLKHYTLLSSKSRWIGLVLKLSKKEFKSKTCDRKVNRAYIQVKSV